MTEVKNETQLKDEFIKEYNTLCDKYLLKIVAFPKWLHDDKGQWMTFMGYSVEKFEKPKPPDTTKVDKVIEEVKAETK